MLAKEGDTFENIGQKFRISARNLRKFNDLKDKKAQPMTDEVVYIERKKKRWEGNAHTHICRQGETAYAVGQSYAIRTRSIEKLNRLTRGNHQGVVAQISAIEYVELADILERVPEDETPLVVVFDGVTDVRNFGAIARSAECAGAHGLVTPLKNSAPVNAEAIRSSAGALATIPVCRVGSIRNTIKLLQTEGFQIVAATEKSRKLLYDADFRKPTALVMGAEDTGISKEVLKLCDEQLAIPLIGHIESLNVSAAAAVMLFEVVRQRIGQ